MAIHKLTFDDFQEEDFNLISIYTSVEDYYLVFVLNKLFGLHFQRSITDLKIKNKQEHSLFEYQDKLTEQYFFLIKNRTEIHNDRRKDELFNINEIVYVLPEFEQIDYLLKIEPADNDIANKIISELRKLPKITVVSELNKNTLKNKSNIILI